MSSTVRVVLTVVICTALLIVWQFFFAKKAQPPPAGSGTGSAARRARAGTGGKAGTGAGRTAGTAKRAEAPSSQPASQPTRDPKLGPVTYSVEGQQFTVDLAHARATFSNRNGTLRHWVLKDPKYTEKRGGKHRPSRGFFREEGLPGGSSEDDKHPRRHPERHHVRQAVQLFSQFAAPAERPGGQAVQDVETRPCEDQPTRDRQLSLGSQQDGGHPAA